MRRGSDPESRPDRSSCRRRRRHTPCPPRPRAALTATYLHRHARVALLCVVVAGPARAEERRATLIRVAREQADAAVAIDARGTVGAFAVADAIDGAEPAGIIGARNEATVIAFAG